MFIKYMITVIKYYVACKKYNELYSHLGKGKNTSYMIEKHRAYCEQRSMLKDRITDMDMQLMFRR